MRKETRLAFVGALIVLVSGFVAWRVQTDGGRVAIRDLRFAASNGTVMSALLYIPKTATAKTPAPAILAVHGYINSRETQDGFAIEFARRGYVVLALDQTGHGYSDPPAFANGFGGPDGLAYLRSLNIVDKDNIGMDFRFWVVALKPMSPLQFRIFLNYALPFIAFFFVTSLAWNGELRPAGGGSLGSYLFTMFTAAGGFLVFLLIQYIPLFSGATLFTASEPLNVIVAIQFLPLMIVAALNSTWFYEKTGRIWAGAFVNGLFIAWYIVAGQATQFPIH